MNTTQLKRFAAEARNKLREGVKGRLIRLGFDLKTGEVPEKLRPELVQGGGKWKGQTVSTAFVNNWEELYNHIKQIGIKRMIEEGAYTWFNRLVAIRILVKNDLCDAVLQYVDSARTPRIVDEARTGRIPAMSDEQLQHLDELLEDDRLVTEQFAVLINAWVNNNPIISTCFNVDSKHFIELLLPDDIRSENGFLDMLNSADFITDEDYRSPELIGWLYQFYISERKDEVFAKKGKYDADEIAPATQIFTPNWIVKYMVQNTVGRIYLDANPTEKRMAEGWKYLVEPSESEKEQTPLQYGELENLRVADLACGSGHILNECFDLLYELYIHEGYSRREAITNIFKHNLTGIDIDLRAKQLATFALLLKACQRDSSFADAHCLPMVLTIPEMPEIVQNPESYLQHFFLGSLTDDATKELCNAWDDLKNADILGSIIKFNISESTRKQIKDSVDSWRSKDSIPYGIQIGLPIMDFILTLTEKYDAIVMNPPYMPCNKIDVLNKYVNTYYKEGKADLFAVFMQVCMDRLHKYGRMGMINMQSWMFLSSFEILRKYFISNYSLSTMLHLGPRTFDELSGEVVQNTAFVFVKVKPNNSTENVYFRLVNGKNCNEKKKLFLSNRNIYVVNQSNFGKIPGISLGYWVSDKIINYFNENKFNQYFETRHGLLTGRDDEVLRLWYEVNFHLIAFNAKNVLEFHNSPKKYIPTTKGGLYRKWYGNLDLICKFDKDTINYMQKYPKFSLQSKDKYCMEGLTWSLELHKDSLSVRYLPKGCVFGHRGPGAFAKNSSDLYALFGFLASNVLGYFFNFLSPSLSLSAGTFNKLPIIHYQDWKSKLLDNTVKSSISISRADWDAHETSWDFQVNEIVGLNNNDKYIALVNGIYEGSGIIVDLAAPQLDSLEWRTDMVKAKWSNKFKRLHTNEEELNRRFIEIYGLQDELSPDVPLNEVTILQQGEISVWKDGDPVSHEVKNDHVEYSSIVWHDDVLMKQLISYAVGCMMGRYRLDRPGLAVAHPDASAEEIAPYPFNGEMFEIDDDAIIPLMPSDCGFYDNATQRMSDFVRQVFGVDRQTENLNYIEKCLGKSIEQYFIKDFWKDHKKMYQNRPIYWLFSSKKGAFQVITYMHRMTPYTVERIRAKYLLPYIETLGNRIVELKTRENELSTAERRLLDSLQKQLEECREYHDRLAVVAERAVGFDLDDGVLHNYALYGDILSKLK